MSPRGQRRRLRFDCDAYPGQLEVLSFFGVEQLSRPYEFFITLVSRKLDLNLDSVVGDSARLTIAGRQATRHVRGIIARFALHQVREERAIYHAILVPPMHRLALRHDVRMFQRRTTRQIVSDVFQRASVKDLDWRLRGSYQPRDYCVQYRESDLSFVSRLLEEEGIACHFEHGAAAVKTVFTDDPGALPDLPGGARLPYSEDTARPPAEEFVFAFEAAEQLASGKVELRDYSFKTPRVQPMGRSTGAASDLEVYDYPGEFVDAGLGARLAGVRLQELELERRSGAGASDCPRFCPGHVWQLGGGSDERLRHPRAELNQRYLLASVIHRGEQPNVLGEEGGTDDCVYGNRFTVVPASVTFRPPRITPRPEARGLHTGQVAGPAGQEIHTDPYGRVKVSFHWDRNSAGDDTSSCWIRVAHDWAGAGYGAMMLPRVGQEVLVAFVEGDPDRPVVVGRVHNATQKVPYDLPMNKTRTTFRSSSSPGGHGSNELRLEDRAGHEQVYLHAQKDLVVEVEHDRTTLVKRDRTEKIKRDHADTVEQTRGLQVAEKSTVEAKNVTYEARERLTLQVGGSSVVMTPGSITISGASISSSSTGLTTINGAALAINPGGGGGAPGAAPGELADVEAELDQLNKELAEELALVAVDAAGVFDPTPISDAVGAAMSLRQGDLLGAGLSLISMVPYVGDALGKTAKGARAARKIARLRKRISTLMKRARRARKAPDADGLARAPAGPTRKATPEELERTQRAMEQRADQLRAEQSLHKRLDDNVGDRAPTLKKDMEALEKDGWSIRETAQGDRAGSYCDRQNRAIVVDKNKTPDDFTGAVSHEVGHAKYRQDPHQGMRGKTRQEYIESNIERHAKDEGEATLYQLDVRDELLKNGGPDTTPRYRQTETYEQVHRFVKKGKVSREDGRKMIGNTYRHGETASGVGKTYGEIWEEPYAKHFDTYGAQYGGKPG